MNISVTMKNGKNEGKRQAKNEKKMAC